MESFMQRVIRLASSPLPSRNAVRFDPESRRITRADAALPVVPNNIAVTGTTWGGVYTKHSKEKERGDGLPPHQWTPKMWAIHALEWEGARQTMQGRRWSPSGLEDGQI